VLARVSFAISSVSTVVGGVIGTIAGLAAGGIGCIPGALLGVLAGALLGQVLIYPLIAGGLSLIGYYLAGSTGGWIGFVIGLAVLAGMANHKS
jgi:hypothetical protein